MGKGNKLLKRKGRKVWAARGTREDSLIWLYSTKPSLDDTIYIGDSLDCLDADTFAYFYGRALNLGEVKLVSINIK